MLWVFAVAQQLSLAATNGGCSPAAGQELLIVAASLTAEAGSGHVGFSTCGTTGVLQLCGILFPDLGPKPCTWQQVDLQSLDHQEAPMKKQYFCKQFTAASGLFCFKTEAVARVMKSDHWIITVRDCGTSKEPHTKGWSSS